MDISKAYKYYTDNIDKSDNKKILDYQTFSQLFQVWVSSLAQGEAFNPGIEQIPVINNKGKSKIISIQSILNKIQ